VETAAEAGRRRGRERAARERLLVPVRYALVRLRRHWPRTLLVALGIAVGAAVVATTAVAAASVQDRAVQRALAQLAPSDRAIQAVWSGVPAQSSLSYAQLDRLARDAVEPILGQKPFAVTVFRQATWGGAFVNLGAVDGLARWLDLRAGRLPHRCTPTDCELVQIGGAPVAPKLPFLRVVGRASFKAGAPLESYFGGGGGHRPPILLADGVRPFGRAPLPDAPLIARTYGWIVPVAPRSIHDWQLASLGTKLDRAQSSLERRSDIFTVAAPTDTIQAIRATSRVASERLLILGGSAAVLLLGFAVLASTRLRRDYRDVRQRLVWSGASRSQILLVAATEVVGITAAATVVGWLAGTGAGALLARHLGSPGGLVVEHSILTTRSLAIGLALGVLTAAAMLAALRVDSVAFGGLRITVADAAALGALAAILLALARGKADTSTLQESGGTGVLLLLLPALVLFVLAVAAARLLAPTLRLLEWAARHTRPAIRIALLSLARAPGEVVLTIVFFVLSVGIAVFAISYRSTLVQGEREQARFAVPAPYVAQEDLGRLVTVQRAPLPRARPVLRESGFVSGNLGRDFTLVALPPAALAGIDGWRSDFSAHSPAQLASLLRPPETPRLRGLRLSGSTLTLPFTTTGDRVGITAIVENSRGDFTPLDLGEHDAGRHVATVRIPPESRGGRLVAIRLSFPVIAAYVAGHRSAETSLSVNDASRGTLRLGPRFAGWFGTAGVRVDGPLLRFVVNNAADAIIRPHEPLEGALVPIVATPAIARAAGPSGIVPLHAENHVIDAKIVATTRYFPSVEGDAVVADLATWLAAANTLEPGVAAPSELWTSVRPPAGTPLAVTSQRARERELESDPLARGAISLLVVTALVGLVLAAVGLILTVVGDVGDDSRALYDLSAQGATPAQLRRHVLLRAGVVGTLGLLGGLAAGAIVSALVVAVVTVTASAENALPPLTIVVDWALLAVALGVFVATGAAGAVAVVRRTL
jgi:putative ABC transport system permease protein